jgi:hypothetical protein
MHHVRAPGYLENKVMNYLAFQVVDARQWVLKWIATGAVEDGDGAKGGPTTP